MKTKIAAGLLVLLLVLSCLTACGGDITDRAQSASVVGRAVPTFTVDANGDFTVLQFTDTHLISGTTGKDEKTLTAVHTQIEAQKPDLVVISGDMIEGSNVDPRFNKLAAIEAVGTLFEELGQYWAYVPGNNDGEKNGSTEDVVAVLSAYNHCIVADEENSTGATQYAVDLQRADGTLAHSLIFMDSLARDANNDYDYMKADQVQWVSRTIAEKQSANPNGAVSLFFHMNTPNFALSGQNGTPYSEEIAPVPADFYTGIDGNAALDSALADAGCVGLVSIGHIHPETNYVSFYNNTYYQVVRSSGYAVTDTPGCSLITIHSNAETAEDMYDFTEIAF